MHNLAGLLVKTDNKSEACELFEKVLELRTNSLGRTHAQTISTMDGLADLYIAQHSFAKAEPLCRVMMDQAVGKAGEKNASTLYPMSRYAHVLMMQNRLQEAKMTLEKASAQAIKILPLENMDRIMLHATFGKCLVALKRFKEAETQLLFCYNGSNELNGMKHPMTTGALSLLTRLYELWDKPEKAARYRALMRSPVKTPAK